MRGGWVAVNAETYVHRVGRTARTGSVGKGLMEPFLKMMKTILGDGVDQSESLGKQKGGSARDDAKSGL